MRRESLQVAFGKVADATVELDRVRHLLSELHYRLEEVDNSKFLLDNIGRWADPADDAHEVLFERKKRAEQKLDELLASSIVPAIKASLDRAQKLALDATQKVEES